MTTSTRLPEQAVSDASVPRREPATLFVADFVGTMSLFTGSVTVDGIALENGTMEPCTNLTSAMLGQRRPAVRLEDVRFVAAAAASDGTPATVVRQAPRGHYKDLLLRVGDNGVRACVPSDLSLPDDAVRVSFARVLVYRDGELERQAEPDPVEG